MNIYKAPNLIISPKCKVYRRGGGINEEVATPPPLPANMYAQSLH